MPYYIYLSFIPIPSPTSYSCPSSWLQQWFICKWYSFRFIRRTVGTGINQLQICIRWALPVFVSDRHWTEPASHSQAQQYSFRFLLLLLLFSLCHCHALRGRWGGLQWLAWMAIGWSLAPSVQQWQFNCRVACWLIPPLINKPRTTFIVALCNMNYEPWSNCGKCTWRTH